MHTPVFVSETVRGVGEMQRVSPMYLLYFRYDDKDEVMSFRTRGCW